MKDNLYTSKQARTRIISGIKKCREAIGSTMGSAGWNSIVEAIERPGFAVINDGWKILNSIHFEDSLEELGRKMLVEAVNSSNKTNGDGSTGATVMTAAILEEGQKYIGEVSPLELKNSLEACMPIIEKSLRTQSREITVDTVGDVASISAQDEKLGALIQEIYKQIGKDGIIQWDLSGTTEDFYKIGNGIEINGAGYASEYMLDVEEKTGKVQKSAKFKNPPILVTQQKLSSIEEINHLVAYINSQGGKDLVIFYDEVEPMVVDSINRTRFREKDPFRICLVKMPVIWKDQWYEDLGLALGATVIDVKSPVNLKNVRYQHLGTCSNITITKQDTTIEGIKDLTLHIASLQAGTDDDKIRAARLNTKTARLYIGDQSESALSYKRYKVEDAISAAWQSLHGGIVAGGGVALKDAINDLPDTIGGKILKIALLAPISQIMANAGIVGEIDDQGMGFNARTKEKGNMFDFKIIDPTNIIITSCKNAISVAASALTASSVVLLPKDDSPQLVDPRMLIR